MPYVTECGAFCCLCMSFHGCTNVFRSFRQFNVVDVVQQALSHTDSRAAEAAEVFFSEAQRLYKEEKAIDPQFESAIMTVAAAQLLSVAASRQGLEEVSQQYLVTGIQLAHQNGFLAVKKRNSARNWLDGDISNVRAASFAACTYSSLLL